MKVMKSNKLHWAKAREFESAIPLLPRGPHSRGATGQWHVPSKQRKRSTLTHNAFLVFIPSNAYDTVRNLSTLLIGECRFHQAQWLTCSHSMRTLHLLLKASASCPQSGRRALKRCRPVFGLTPRALCRPSGKWENQTKLAKPNQKIFLRARISWCS